MDKNTIAGLVIIFLILIGFSYLTRPSKEQVAEMQRKQDSIARVDRLRAQELAAQQQAQKTPDNTTAANPLARWRQAQGNLLTYPKIQLLDCLI